MKMTQEEYWKWFQETLGRISEATTTEMPDRIKLIRLWAAANDLQHQLAHCLGDEFIEAMH